MADNANRRRGTLTRRGLLGAATAALAGCTALDGVTGDDEPTVEAYGLPDVGRNDSPESPVPPAVPVDVPSGAFTEGRTRVTDLLSELPLPLGPDEIPNGHVRAELTHQVEHATDGLDDALTAPSQLAALHSLGHAREAARYAAAGWAYADNGLTAATMAQALARVRSAARTTRWDHEYVGTDPVTAAVVHAEIEEALADAVRTHPPGGEETALLTVAEWGETVESAAASLDAARYLRDAYPGSVPDGGDTVESALTAAAADRIAAARRRRSDLPPEPTADSRTLSRLVRRELRYAAEDGLADLEDADGPASAVVDANRELAAIEAYERVRRRHEAGDITLPETADGVRDRRQRAIDTLTSALRESPTPALLRTALVRPANRVVRADRELARLEGEVPVSRLDHPLAEYEVATAVAEAAPSTTERTVSALR
jgi:hypothetical protein